MAVVTKEGQAVAKMFDPKRAMTTSAGILALTASAYLTVATAPIASITSGGLLASHGTVAAQTASRSTTAAAVAIAPATSRIAPVLNHWPQELVPAPVASPADRTSSHADGTPSHAGFGHFISGLARLFPGGPEHGKLISFFAKLINPGHTTNGRTPSSSAHNR
jgi:hypothetical protein